MSSSQTNYDSSPSSHPSPPCNPPTTTSHSRPPSVPIPATATDSAPPPASPPHSPPPLGAHSLTRTALAGQVRPASRHLPPPQRSISPAKSTISRLNATPLERAACEKRMASAVRTILECIGEDPDREGLLRTPDRYAQALMWMTRGYEERLAGTLPSHPISFSTHSPSTDVINDAVFAEDHDEMVLVRDIDISSLCEHHLVPFTGKVGSIQVPHRPRSTILRLLLLTFPIISSWASPNSRELPRHSAAVSKSRSGSPNRSQSQSKKQSSPGALPS